MPRGSQPGCTARKGPQGNVVRCSRALTPRGACLASSLRARGVGRRDAASRSSRVVPATLRLAFLASLARRPSRDPVGVLLGTRRTHPGVVREAEDQTPGPDRGAERNLPRRQLDRQEDGPARPRQCPGHHPPLCAAEPRRCPVGARAGCGGFPAAAPGLLLHPRGGGPDELGGRLPPVRPQAGHRHRHKHGPHLPGNGRHRPMVAAGREAMPQLMLAFTILLTVGVYLLCKALYLRHPHPLLNIVLLGAGLVIATLLALKIPYQAYVPGRRIMTALLGPATVGLAVPLYRHRGLLRRYAPAIVAGVGVGVLVSMLVAMLIALAFGLPREIVRSLLPKSVTIP